MQKKVCLLGSTGVGKTSLLHRFAHRAYSATYLTTLGVRIEKHVVTVDSRALGLMFWDTEGQDQQPERLRVLRGASGYVLVADGTRRQTLDAACALQRHIEQTIGRPIPFQLLINKADLETWDIDPAVITAIEQSGWPVWSTSAKTGCNVEAAFQQLGRAMLAAGDATAP